MSTQTTTPVGDVTELAHPLPTRGLRAGVPGWWRDAVGVATWLSMLVVVALWVAGRGVQAMSTFAGAATSLGRLTGLVAADLMLIQVLLMARIPLVERVYGQDDLARRHRRVGNVSFFLMLAHVLLIVLGYSLTLRTNVIAESWDLVVNAPGMLLALAGTLLLVLVVALSIRAARRRLRYESWHLIHLYAYLGVGLVIPHMLWSGQEFVTNPVATGYWWTLWAAAAGCFLVFRLGLPLFRSLFHRLRVTDVTRESADVVSVRMHGKHLDRLPASAGQFFTWRFLAGAGWTRGHPYSLSAAPDGTGLRITVKDLGDAGRALATVRPGTRVLIEGPYGRLTTAVRTRAKVTLMASGIGISPLRALLEDFDQSPGDVTLLYRARTLEDLVLRSEVDAIARRTGARVFHLLGPRLPGRSSWLPASAAGLSDAEALRRLVPDIAEHDVYLCGANAWMEAARAAARACGVPATRIHQERFSW